MKLSSRKVQHEQKIALSMTSMIDVVFLLLIFFMTTASFVKTERDLDSAIKVNEKSAAEASDLEPAIVEIVPGGTGFVFRVGARELLSDDELTNVLRAFPNKLDGAFVRVANGAPFRMAASAIQACKDADFISVSYVPMD
ncbi:MAG: biopolymer transporter ExbD [Planctomycetaceae bacterium]|nr:biopolymer transporter ExbD [Planctomycetales bacterium]MCB9921865.1 biopolymer transporter ExbD [Planctomycetaceae bacterium]